LISSAFTTGWCARGGWAGNHRCCSWPADKAVQHARDRIRELTGRRRLLLPPEAIAQDVNMFLRGWAAYFKYGHSARRLSQIRRHAWMRLALFISKKHRRKRSPIGSAWRKRGPGPAGLLVLACLRVLHRTMTRY
jgi:RNA-directed DNA polymerase